MGEAVLERLKQKGFRSPQMEAAVNLLVAADAIRRQISEICRTADLTDSQYNVLRILRGQPEGHPRCEIAGRMIDAAPDVTRLVDRLEKRGLVERLRCKEDRRLSLTRITDAGREVLRELDPAIESMWASLADRLTDEDSAALSALCEKVYAPEIE
ncbi:MAG: MarR family transcriptional regulator [Acidobacteria bacterium]|nr:MarR family transcriptional regulator [Acidobacteriota bacterium]